MVMFNTTDRAEDVSHEEILRRLDIEGRSVPSVLEDFIDRHAGNNRQLTLQLALRGRKEAGRVSKSCATELREA